MEDRQTEELWHWKSGDKRGTARGAKIRFVREGYGRVKEGQDGVNTACVF